MLVSTSQSPYYNLSNVRDILEYRVGNSFSVFYLLRRSSFSWRARDSVLPPRIVRLYAYLADPATRIQVAEFCSRRIYHEYFDGTVLLATLGKLENSLLIRTCWPTLNLTAARRTELFLERILFHNAIISESVTLDGALPVALWTVSLYPLTNFGSTSMYRTCFCMSCICTPYRESCDGYDLQYYVSHSDHYILDIKCPSFSACPGMICSKTLCPYLFAPRSAVCVEVSNILRGPKCGGHGCTRLWS